MLDLAIVPPHLTVLSMRMAVANYVMGISTPEVHPEFPPLLGTLTPCLPEEPITRSLGNHTDAFAPFFIASTSPTDLGSFADVG
jgi:hypothetical protein